MDDKDYPCLNARELISNSAMLSSNYISLLSDLYTWRKWHRKWSHNLLDSPPLQLCFFNACSIVSTNSIKFKCSLIFTVRLSKLLQLQEHWLTGLITDKDILPVGFTIFWKDQDTRRGGVLLAIHQSFCNNSNCCEIVYPSTSGDMLCIFASKCKSCQMHQSM